MQHLETETQRSRNTISTPKPESPFKTKYHRLDLKDKSVCDSLRNCSHIKTEYPYAVRAEMAHLPTCSGKGKLQWRGLQKLEGNVMCLGGTDRFLLPGLPDHRGPDGGSKTKTHGWFLSFMGQTFFSIVGSCYPSSVDQASPEGRCHAVAMNTSWESVYSYDTVHCSKKHLN